MDAVPDQFAAQQVDSMMNVSDVLLVESIRERLKIQRDTGRFCDVVFHVHSIEFLAHRCILAACSPYFDSVLDLNRVGKEHLTISADWKIFSELIDFIYTGKIYIHEGNVAELLRLSGYFLMSGLKDYCGEFLERSMAVKNCLGIKGLSEKCGLLNLAINSTAFIQDHINELSDELEFLELSKAKLEAFLKNKAFNITNELKLVMISRWVMHGWSEREEHFKSLLTLIPVQQVDHQRVTEIVQTENLYHTSQHCLYHILHELYSFGVHLGSLEATYTDLCQKMAAQPTSTLVTNVLDLAVNTALGDMSSALQESTDQNVGKVTVPGAEVTGQVHQVSLSGTSAIDNNPAIRELEATNRENYFNVVLPADVSDEKSEKKIVDHLSYTKVEDMDIVKEHVFEETNAGGLVYFKPRFQGSRNDKPSSTGTGDAGKSAESETVPSSSGNDSVGAGDESNQVLIVTKKEPDEDEEAEGDAADDAVPMSMSSDMYEGDTDADYTVEDEDDDDEYLDDEGQNVDVPQLNVKEEPTEITLEAEHEKSRRKRKGRPRKSENIAEGSEAVYDPVNEGDEEWTVESSKNRKATATKGKRKTAKGKPSATMQSDKKKNLVMKISVKRKKGAKKTVPPKRQRVPKVKETFRCEECNFTAKYAHRIDAHYRTVHKQNVVQACSQCDFKTSWNKEYYQHMRQHFTGPPFTCDEEGCEYVTEKFQLLLHHRRRHSDERPYCCETCGMKFRTKNNLTSHARCHSGEKPFQCPDCKRCFATKSTLNQHSVTHSNHRPYLCDTCGFSTKYQSHLIAHKRIHTGDVYRCAHAGCKYFTPKRSQLNAHMRIHMSIRSHICSQCGRGFVERSHLVRHEKLHTNEKGFKCTDCDYATYRRDKLKLHIEKHHTPGASSSNYKPRKQRTPKANNPNVFQGVMQGNYGYPAGQYVGVPVGQQVDTKPSMPMEEHMYASPQLDQMNVREQYPMYVRPQTPPSGNQAASPPGMSPNTSGAPTTLTNVRQPRVAGYIVQPMSGEQNQGVYTPQGDIGGLGAFMALF